MYYLEIVSNDVDGVAKLYELMHHVTFGAPDADLGHARVATLKDGSLIGIRKPLAAHEEPITRMYLAVDNIAEVTKEAVAAGGTLAYGPTGQGARGWFAILFHGGVQHGLWQREVT